MSLRRLVGPRGFEPRTSCTPSKFQQLHVRVWAEEGIYAERSLVSEHCSGVVELETDNLPSGLDLVLVSTKSPFR